MTLFIREGGNIYVGEDAGANASKHKNLETFGLPTLEELEQKHLGGGTIGELAVGGLGLTALEASFKLVGDDPQVMSQFGKWRTPFSFYGSSRDKSTNRLMEVRAVVRGRLGKIEGDNFKKGDLMGHDHAIRKIMRYICYFDGVEKYWYDWDTSDWRIDGEQMNADERRILRIPGV